MKTIEEVLYILKKHGIKPLKEKNMLSFNHQKLNYLYLEDEQNDNYFSMYLPGVFEVNEQNEQTVLQMVNRVNGDMRLVKLAVHGHFVWIGVELPLYEKASTGEVVTMTLDLLHEAWLEFFDLWQNLTDKKSIAHLCNKSPQQLLN